MDKTHQACTHAHKYTRTHDTAHCTGSLRTRASRGASEGASGWGVPPFPRTRRLSLHPSPAQIGRAGTARSRSSERREQDPTTETLTSTPFPRDAAFPHLHPNILFSQVEAGPTAAQLETTYPTFPCSYLWPCDEFVANEMPIQSEVMGFLAPALNGQGCAFASLSLLWDSHVTVGAGAATLYPDLEDVNEGKHSNSQPSPSGQLN